MEIDLALDNSLVIDDPIDAAIQELDILMSTENTEMLGDPSFGVNLEQFLWQLTPSPIEVKSYLDRKILESTFWCTRLNVNVAVDVLPGTLRNIYEVTITLQIPNGSKEVSKKYQFR